MFDFTEVGLNLDIKFFITVEPLLWDTSTQRLLHSEAQNLVSKKCSYNLCILIKIKEINIRTYSH